MYFFNTGMRWVRIMTPSFTEPAAGHHPLMGVLGVLGGRAQAGRSKGQLVRYFVLYGAFRPARPARRPKTSRSFEAADSMSSGLTGFKTKASAPSTRAASRLAISSDFDNTMTPMIVPRAARCCWSSANTDTPAILGSSKPKRTRLGSGAVSKGWEWLRKAAMAGSQFRLP